MKSYLIQVDVEQSSYFTQSVSVEGETFNFRFLWNERDSLWYMDVSSVNGSENGIRLIPNENLLISKRVTRKGNFMLLQTSSDANPNDMKYSDFGNKFQLYFIPNEV